MSVTQNFLKKSILCFILQYCEIQLFPIHFAMLSAIIFEIKYGT